MDGSNSSAFLYLFLFSHLAKHLTRNFFLVFLASSQHVANFEETAEVSCEKM